MLKLPKIANLVFQNINFAFSTFEVPEYFDNGQFWNLTFANSARDLAKFETLELKISSLVISKFVQFLMKHPVVIANI